MSYVIFYNLASCDKINSWKGVDIMVWSSSWWSVLQPNPNLTIRLFIIITFLSLIAIGNIFGIYDGMVQQNNTATLQAIAAMLLYAIPAYGLFTLKPWARLLELFKSILLVILGFLMVLFDNIGTGSLVMIIHGMIASYLITTECKHAFATNSQIG
jgi:hypothetical protein